MPFGTFTTALLSLLSILCVGTTHKLFLLWNWPVTEDGAKQAALTVTIICWIWAMYYAVAPWVYWKAWEYGRTDKSCLVYNFIFTKADSYSNGLWIWNEVSSVFSPFIALILFLVGCVFIVLWCTSIGDGDIVQFYQELQKRSAILAIRGLVCGVFSIVFTEMTIKINNITFPDSSIASNSGQLIALLIGTFTLFRAVFRIPTSLIWQ